MASDIESALFAFLRGTSAITTTLGGPDNIFPVKAKEGALPPVLTYQKISGPSVNTKDGTMHLASPRFQFTCWAAMYAEAKAVIKQVRLALEAYTGPALQGINVPQIIVDNEQDLFDAQSQQFGVALDAIIWHSN